MSRGNSRAQFARELGGFIRRKTPDAAKQAAQILAIDPTDPVTPRWQVAAASHGLVDQVGSAVTTQLRLDSGRLSSQSSGVNWVAFSPDGKLLASAYADGTVRVWLLATGHLYGQALRANAGSQTGVNGVAFSPDGKLLAGAGADGTIRLWNPATGQPVGSPLPVGSSVNGVAFSPDGKLLAGAGADGTIRLWNPATGHLYGQALRANAGSQTGVNGVAFSPDGKLLAGAGADGIVWVWNPATGQPAGSPVPFGSSVNGVAFSPDGKLLASANADGTIRLWNPTTGQPAEPNSGGWWIILASVIAITLSAFAALITIGEIRLAKQSGNRIPM